MDVPPINNCILIFGINEDMLDITEYICFASSCVGAIINA